MEKGLTRIYKSDIIFSCQVDVCLPRNANVAQSVEQRFRKPQVKGSSPFIGSIRGVAQFGSAFGSGPKGRRFKSCHLDQILRQIQKNLPFLFV